MFEELLLRFVFGGAIVAAFAAAGELFTPKRFSGMFGSAPSVALATLGLSFSRRGGSYVELQGRSMVLGAVAMLVYASLLVLGARVRAIPIWVGALVGWGVWLGVALGLWGLARAIGALR